MGSNVTIGTATSDVEFHDGRVAGRAGAGGTLVQFRHNYMTHPSGLCVLDLGVALISEAAGCREAWRCPVQMCKCANTQSGGWPRFRRCHARVLHYINEQEWCEFLIHS